MRFNPANPRPTHARAPRGGFGSRAQATTLRNNRNNNVSLPQAGD